MGGPKNISHALVIQGGSLRSIFTSGVLDAFLEMDYNPFDGYIGVSGGAMCLSYYLSKQKGATRKIISDISQDPRFINIWNAFSDEGYVNLAYLEEYSQSRFPLDINTALKSIKDKYFGVVATNIADGEPVYLKPAKGSWMECLNATATLPFFTRGTTDLGKLRLMDGGWSDPIPVKKAYALGARKIVAIRTVPTDYKQDWSLLGVFGGFYHRTNSDLSWRFNKDYEYYNDSVDFANNPPEGCTIYQIAPPHILKTKDYKATPASCKSDYHLGYRMGKLFIERLG